MTSPPGDDRPNKRPRPGGLIHTYQGYDPKNFPSPTRPPPDLASAAYEHMLRFGSTRRLTPEQLADAVRLDPSQIAGLGPSLDALIELLEERKRKILETYETQRVQGIAREGVSRARASVEPPPDLPEHLREPFEQVAGSDQIRGIERLYMALRDDNSPAAVSLLRLRDRLADQYQIDELASKYAFTGREELSVERALEVKEELETIDRLLEQLREALQSARIGVIDLDELREFVDQASVEQLQAYQQQVREYLDRLAEEQGLDTEGGSVNLSPKAMRLFQGKLLELIFSDLQAARHGRHSGPVVGEGAVETTKTRPYEFGDSATHMDIPGSFTNAMIRRGAGTGPVRLRADDIRIHETRNTPKCATTVLIDMSGSMRHGGQYVHCKRMALALDALIRTEYPGDFLQCFEMASFARPVHVSRLPELMPKPVTIHDPVVRIKADMSDERISESMVPPHFTNIQHGLSLSRKYLGAQDTPNRQVLLITDGLPTAHFEGPELYLLYPPDPLTERQTMREAQLCQREGIVINIFLLPSWSQDEDDIAFAHRLAETTSGRVLFTAGDDLDRFVVWDYVNHRRSILG